MMNFYKLTPTEDDKDIYINPKSIMAYYYKDEYTVNIFLNGGDYIPVSKSDFINMMILEGGSEYWNTPQFIEYQ